VPITTYSMTSKTKVLRHIFLNIFVVIQSVGYHFM